MPNESRRSISTDMLVELVKLSNGALALPADGAPTMPTIHPSLSALQADIAICIGGGNDPIAEFETAKALCVATGKSYAVFACNSILATLPGIITHGITLHPDLWQGWRSLRERTGHPMPLRLWAHRPYPLFTDYTKDWQGSSGLFAVKIARELGYTHIILCGIPMTAEGRHFVREQLWHEADGFRKGWARVQGSLRPFVRSMSGWTKEHFGFPDPAWLVADIADPYPMKGLHDHSGVKA